MLRLFLCRVLCLGLFLFTLPLPAAEEKRMPTYAECQTLMNPDTKVQDRVLLELSFFPRRPVCEIISRPFPANNLFHPGRQNVRLRFTVTRNNIYEPDLASLLTALAPDRENIPKDKAMAMAGNVVGALFSAASGDISNPQPMLNTLAGMGEIAGALGNNAATVKAEAASLRLRHSLLETDLVAPKWLDTLAQGRAINRQQSGFVAAVTRMLRSFSRMFPWMNGQAYGAGE
jgi:hypothetical protein